MSLHTDRKIKHARITAKFDPLLLTQEQKEQRVSMNQKLLDRTNNDEHFLINIINWVMKRRYMVMTLKQTTTVLSGFQVNRVFRRCSFVHHEIVSQRILFESSSTVARCEKKTA